jgi:N-dimethylarginine dimethylaminohydrolase
MPIDVTKAIQQQNAYELCLTELGVRVISLGVEDDLPDSVTRELLTVKGFQVRAIDISEFEKAEGSLTCLSLLFDIENTERHSLTDLPLITS